MTKFKFRLEAALRLRHLRVEAETSRLQGLIAQQQRLEQSLATLRAERLEASSFVHTVRDPAAQDLRALSLFTVGLEARARTLVESIDNMALQVQAQKERLLGAERDEMALVKLRDKRFTEWQVKTEREIESAAQELWLFSHTTPKEDREDG